MRCLQHGSVLQGLARLHPLPVLGGRACCLGSPTDGKGTCGISTGHYPWESPLCRETAWGWITLKPQSASPWVRGRTPLPIACTVWALPLPFEQPRWLCFSTFLPNWLEKVPILMSSAAASQHLLVQRGPWRDAGCLAGQMCAAKKFSPAALLHAEGCAWPPCHPSSVLLWCRASSASGVSSRGCLWSKM